MQSKDLLVSMAPEEDDKEVRHDEGPDKKARDRSLIPHESHFIMRQPGP